MAWSVTFGMIIGIVSAVWRNRWPDRLGMTLAVSGISFPAFALGMMLMQIFSVNLGWLPTVGASSWKHYILPSITLGAAVAAVMARFTRASFVEVVQEDFVRTARAKGLSERRVVIKHALRNALIPVVTMMGLQFGLDVYKRQTPTSSTPASRRSRRCPARRSSRRPVSYTHLWPGRCCPNVRRRSNWAAWP